MEETIPLALFPTALATATLFAAVLVPEMGALHTQLFVTLLVTHVRILLFGI